MRAARRPAFTQLRAELEQRCTLVLDRSWTHPSFADLILAHGRDYDPAPWPVGAHPERVGDCFAAAHEWAERAGWTYCEGYTLSCDAIIGAFEHAWCLTPDGRVADPAIPDGWVLAYCGLPLTDTFIRAQDRGENPVITIPHDPYVGPNTTVLRDGLPPDAPAAGPPGKRNSCGLASSPGREA